MTTNYFMNFSEMLVFVLSSVIVFVIYYFFTRQKILLLVNEKVVIEKLQSRVVDLEEEIKRLRAFIDILLMKLSVVDEGAAEMPVATETFRDLLIVCGNEEFCDADRRALRKSGIRFMRLRFSSFEDFVNELRRRRSDNTLYKVIHFSMHGTSEGLIFGDGELVTGAQLSEVIDGVDIVFLNTCTSVNVADKIASIVEYVIVVYEDIENDLAEQFATEFYSAYSGTRNPIYSFSHAIAVVPEVSEFVDLRRRQ